MGYSVTFSLNYFYLASLATPWFLRNYIRRAFFLNSTSLESSVLCEISQGWLKFFVIFVLIDVFKET